KSRCLSAFSALAANLTAYLAASRSAFSLECDVVGALFPAAFPISVAPNTRDETASFRRVFISTVPIGSMLAARRHLARQLIQLGLRVQILIERLRHDLLGGAVIDGAGEAQPQMPFRIEPQSESGL